MTIAAVIFDLDGTLIDSESLAFVAWERGLRPFGCQFKREHEHLMIGVQLTEALENIKRHFHLEESIEVIFQSLGREWAALTADGLPPMPGAHALLDILDAQQIPWGVATNSEHSYAVQHLSHVNLTTRAKAIVGSDDVEHPKPAPDVFLTCARLMGADPSACIAVEDSGVGHRAAAAAGMTVVVVAEHATSAEFPHAHHILPSLHDFIPTLQHLLQPA